MASSPKVLIAGAGPVGLTLANELVRQGISVRIVDKNVERTDKSKALVLWSRTLELFDDAGYASDFLPAGMPAHGAQISTGKEIVASVSLATRRSFGSQPYLGPRRKNVSTTSSEIRSQTLSGWPSETLSLVNR